MENSVFYPAGTEIYKLNDYGQLRTFCTCRGGEVWGVEYGGFKTISGRSDSKETDFSNFSLLARFTGESLELCTKHLNSMMTTE